MSLDSGVAAAAASTRQQVNEHRADLPATVETDERSREFFAPAGVGRLAAPDRRDVLRADLVVVRDLVGGLAVDDKIPEVGVAAVRGPGVALAIGNPVEGCATAPLASIVSGVR